MCLVKLPASKDGKLQSLQFKDFPHYETGRGSQMSQFTCAWLFPMWFFNRNSVLNFLSHVAIRLLFLVVLSEVPLETNFITKNFATILAGSFLTHVHAPQLCDGLKNFHFWCRIEHFYFLGGMLPQLSNFGSILNTVFFRSWIGVEGDGVGKNFRNHHEEGRARASSSFLVRCHSLTRLVAKLAMSERPTWRWGCPTVCGLPIRAMIFGVALA